MPIAAPLIRDLRRNALLALAYTLVAWASLSLALPPFVASPLFPAAGLALAALLAWGPRCTPGVFMGSLLANAAWGLATPGLDLSSQALVVFSSILIAFGSTLQAWLGAWSIRRVLRPPLLLYELRDLWRFYAIGALSCGVSAGIGTLSLVFCGLLPPELWDSHMLQWWIGDTFGVLIATPAVLTLIGRPASAWRPRRLLVALPMLLATLVLAQGIRMMREHDQSQASNAFEREATVAFSDLDGALQAALLALQNSRGLFSVAPALGAAEFQRASAFYLQDSSHLQALGWIRSTRRADHDAFDREARSEGFSGFVSHDRVRPGDLGKPTDEDMLVIRLIEPLAGNATALGVNVLSIPGPRAAAELALETGQPIATPAFPLSQYRQKELGVVVYEPVYGPEPGPQAATHQSAPLRGLVFATLRITGLLDAAAANAPDGLQLCLVDLDAPAAQRLLAGPNNCERESDSALHIAHPLVFAGRHWEIRASSPDTIPGLSLSSSWPFAFIGLLSATLLGMLLMGVTGRARQVETLVQSRTAALKREVQERERASAALLASEQLFRTIFDQAPIGLMFTANSHSPLEVNPHFCQLIGHDVENVLRMESADYTHPDDVDEDRRLRRLLRDGEINMYRRNKRYIHKDGHIVPVRVTVARLGTDPQAVQRFVGVVEDVSDQLRMQELERARDVAEGANRAKNDFLSRMSHELRTPLNAMLGFTQLLEMNSDKTLSPRQQGWTGQIQQAGWHLLHMIDDILDLSRIESGGIKLDLGRQDLRSLLDDAWALVQADAAQRGITLRVSIEPDARPVLGDATRIKQVLTNLLSNAVKYNVDGGSIDIVGRREAAGSIELNVVDSGIGLSPEQLAQLFQPFNRLGRERSAVSGTGIGLVISKRLAELMGGGLEARPTADTGSCFVLRLPAAGDQAPADKAPTAAASGSQYAGKRRVLYVEDNPVNAQVMGAILAQRPQIDWSLCTDGQSGLQAVASQPPDLVLLDMQLPDMDGIEWLNRLRQAAVSVPVVVVSATALPEQIERAMQAGALDYLTKPINVAALLDLLDRQLGTPLGAESPA